MAKFNIHKLNYSVALDLDKRYRFSHPSIIQIGKLDKQVGVILKSVSEKEKEV